ncbi:hybrid signal transduction histidine kinase E isoform X3 [Musca domestica]|nr:hybrid signal transduction histidine kinase E isoform X3 [Musca domestica]
MADINNKPKLQIRAGIAVNGDKTPSPATKLLINHGKPNFTIQRSPKVQNGNGTVINGNPLSPQPVAPKQEFVVKSTTFNGVFKPSNVSPVAKPVLLKQNGNITNNNNNIISNNNNNNVNTNNNNNDDHEMNKVVLRRTKVPEPPIKEGEDENVPEFIRRQRRIQERLAKENLDFENRRSGYFTQVLISPSSPNRKSFVETMSSPAVVPSLEIPPPAAQPEKIVEETHEEKQAEERVLQEIAKEIVEEPKEVEESKPMTENGHDEEVNKAIEEVNKAVAGEDDEKPEEEPQSEEHPVQQAVVTSALVEDNQPESVVAVVTSAPEVEETPAQETEAPVQAVVTSALVVEEEEQKPQENGHTEPAKVEEEHKPQENGHVEAVVVTSTPLAEEEPKTNGHVEENGNGITISHTNALATPSLPSPDPSGEKGVNFEPKTVVSFSRELGEVNKYPDTVKVVKEGGEAPQVDDDLKELAKLKFEIKADDKDIEVTPVLKVE